MEDLDGCLVLIIADSKEQMKNKDGGFYDMYKCQVTIVDGQPSEAVEADALPFALEDFGISGSWMIGQIKPSMRNRKPVLGRVFSFKNDRKTTSYDLKEPTDDEKDLARAVAIEMMEANNPFAAAKNED
jgi:hypothetical protein